jgi:hypothetical protein
VHHHLAEATLKMFNETLPHVNAPHHRLILPERSSHIQNYMNISDETVMGHVNNMPERFQCRNYIRIALLLVRRYSAVGVLENHKDMWTTLFQRSGLPKEKLKTAFATNGNASPHKFEKAQLDLATKNLQPHLFCDTFLWKFVQLISDTDRKCVDNET